MVKQQKTRTSGEKSENVESPGASDISTASTTASVNEDPKSNALAIDPETGEKSTDLIPPYSVFTKSQKNFIVFMAAWAGLFSQLSTNIYFPAINALTAEYKVSIELINLSVTTYMIFQALAPTIYGDFADMAGRRPAYLIGFVIFIGANVGLALQHNYVALLVLRCLQSSGSSGTIALGNGVVADITTSAERGTYMGLVMCGPMVGPAIGPILGGIFSQFLGWRSIFWFLTILAGAFLVPFSVAFPETLRTIVGNGTYPPQTWNMSLLNYLTHRKTILEGKPPPSTTPGPSRPRLRCPNPLKSISIILEKDAFLLLLYNSLIYSAFYTVTVSLPPLFTIIYAYTPLQVGLAFIPYGIGTTVASLLGGRIVDLNYRRHCRSNHLSLVPGRVHNLQGFPIEQARIQVVYPFLLLGTAALLCYGWVLRAGTHVAVPLALQFLIGLCLTGAWNVLNTLLVDLFPQCPSTATAANNLVRCLMGAGTIGFVGLMLDGMGYGWCFTLVAGVVGMGSPLLWVVVKWGPGWREERRVREERRR